MVRNQRKPLCKTKAYKFRPKVSERSKILVELSDGLTCVHLDRPAAVPFSHQTVRVDPRRVAVRELLSKPAPLNSHCLRVDPRVTYE
ncbi:hypothetical protein F2Q70_00017859 [Brassica cretica]|uniref:Uncharacterized protein n=1 Tax=Brassica cretica TaxID=69181 RepID=A0A8S9KT04_BRACR|nr:hypothetical protein F2Q70_00017859 [Brassica cretica]KAF2598570.1 hypothetical protein F2Q68_00010824 [Brassica cretica]